MNRKELIEVFGDVEEGDSIVACVYSPNKSQAIKHFVGGEIADLVRLLAFSFQSITYRTKAELGFDYNEAKQALLAMFVEYLADVEEMRDQTHAVKITELPVTKRKGRKK